MLHAATHCVEWWQDKHIVIVTIRDTKHVDGESNISIALRAELTLIGDLQEDSVDAVSWHHKVPTRVVETSMTVGISFLTLPLKVFPINVTAIWSLG